jgi:hypothetical protein
MARPKIYLTKEASKEAKRLNEQRRRERLGLKLKEYNKQWRKTNAKVLDEKRKIYYEKNKEIRIAYTKRWSEENPDRRKETARIGEKRRRKDPLYKFYTNVRSLISSSFKRNKKNLTKILKTEEILGCSLEEFRNYILEKCPEGVEIKDFGRFGYHLDHIMPLDSGKTEIDIINLCHYINIQPLWWIDNLQKSNKILINE